MAMLGSSCSPCCRPPCFSFDPEAITAIEVTLDGEDYIASDYHKCNGFEFGDKTFARTHCFFGSLFTGTYSLSPYVSPAAGQRTSWRYWFEDNPIASQRSFIDVKFFCVNEPDGAALLVQIQTRHWLQTHGAANLVETSIPCVPPYGLTPIPEVSSVRLASQRFYDSINRSFLFADYSPATLPLVLTSRFPLSLIGFASQYNPQTLYNPDGKENLCRLTGTASKGSSSSGTLRFEMTSLKVFF